MTSDPLIIPRDIHFVIARDGVELHIRHFRPAGAEAKRTLVWCHGMGEHGGRYDHVVAEFLKRDWQVIIPDLRGLGLSAGIRADVANFEIYLHDLDLIVQKFALNPARTALFGHSFGGLVMTRYAETRSQDWAALAMSAPLLGISVPIPLWKWCAGRLLSLIAPRTHLKTGVRESNLTVEPAFLAKRRADPLIQRSVTVRWFFSMKSALRLAHREAVRLTLPILIVQGTADETTDPRAPAKWLRMTSSREAQLREYPGRLHELLHDAAWHGVCTDVLNWLDGQLPGEIRGDG